MELLFAVETVSTDLGVDVDALLRDGEQRLQAWNDKYLKRKSAVDSKVSPATETAPQVVELDSIFFCRSVRIHAKCDFLHSSELRMCSPQ